MLLFNAVLEDVFRSVRAEWNKKWFGVEMSLGPRAFLHSLGFADDVVLFASKSSHMEIMLKNIVEAAASRGLHVHPDESKVLTNAWRTSKNKVPNNLHAAGQSFAVLPQEGSVKYLGRKVSLHDTNEVEVSNRIASSWVTFSKHKEKLTDSFSLRRSQHVSYMAVRRGLLNWTNRGGSRRHRGRCSAKF